MSARRFSRLKVSVFATGLGGPRNTKAHGIQADRTRRELLGCDEGDLVFAAVFLMADEVEAGFRHYFPGLEFFLSHNVLSRWGTVDYSTEVRGCRSKNRKQLRDGLKPSSG
jgi:hypothetical protein